MGSGIRSLISYWDEENNTHVVVYCHSDGEPSIVGMMLKKHYSNPTKLKVLINNGDILKLRKDIGEKQDFNNPIDNWTVFYTRDRDDRLKLENIPEFEKLIEKIDKKYCSYLYLFKDNDWKCYDIRGNEVQIPNEETIDVQ